jgi:hypothetical protein
LSEEANRAGREIIAWLAYPDKKNAERATEWLRSWSAINIIAAGGEPSHPPTIRKDRLWQNLANLEHRLRLRLAVGDVFGLNLSAARYSRPPLSEAKPHPINDDFYAALKTGKRRFGDGGTMPPLTFRFSEKIEIAIELKIPPLSSRGLARYFSEQGFGGSTEPNAIRGIIRKSRPVTALAVGCYHHIVARLYNEGLAAVAFSGDWVASAMSDTEKARRELIAYPEFGLVEAQLIEFEWPNTAAAILP